MPTLWGEERPRAARWDALAVWRQWADDVRGAALPRGHFLPEEAPGETAGALERFLTAWPRLPAGLRQPPLAPAGPSHAAPPPVSHGSERGGATC